MAAHLVDPLVALARRLAAHVRGAGSDSGASGSWLGLLGWGGAPRAPPPPPRGAAGPLLHALLPLGAVLRPYAAMRSRTASVHAEARAAAQRLAHAHVRRTRAND